MQEDSFSEHPDQPSNGLPIFIIVFVHNAGRLRSACCARHIRRRQILPALAILHKGRLFLCRVWQAHGDSSEHLTDAIRKLNPHRRNAPWTVLCDNESFLRHPNSQKAYATRNMHPWDVPARSPDLNLIEMFWGRTRRQLRL